MSVDELAPGSSPTRSTARLTAAAGPGMGALVGFAVLSAATHAASLAFTVAGGRLLAPAAFATLVALLGVILVGLAPGMAVQALTAAGTVGGPVTVDLALARQLGMMIGGVVGVLVVVLGPALGTVDPMTVAATALAAAALPMTAAREGVLLGRRRYLALGTALLVGATVKLVAGTVGMYATRTVASAAGGVAIGYLAQLLCSGSLVSGSTLPTREPRGRVHPVVVSAVAMMALLLVLVHADAVLARGVLTGTQAGDYAVGTSAARMVFWSPQFLLLLLFPHLVRDRRRRVVVAALGVVALIGVVVAILAALLGPQLVTVAFGAEFAGIGPGLPRFAWLGASMLGLQVLALSDIAAGRADAARLLAVVLLTVVAVVLVRRPEDAIGLVTLVASTTSTGVIVGLGFRAARRDRREHP